MSFLSILSLIFIKKLVIYKDVLLDIAIKYYVLYDFNVNSFNRYTII